MSRKAVVISTLCVLTAAVGAAGPQIPAGLTADQLLKLQQAQENSSTQVQPSVTSEQMLVTPIQGDRRRMGQEPESRLETLLSDRVGIDLKQFGYDQLGSGVSIVLSQVGGVQDDYILGQGDEIVVSLRGQENAEYRATVDRDGRVVLPRMNPVAASGRNFGDFRRDLQASIHRAYVSTEGFISVGRVRQINVLVGGEVNTAGVLTLNGLSNVADAILAAGGIRKTGSLRRVHIVRGGKTIVVDLYAVLMDQAHGPLPTLTNGDRVVVPPIGPSFGVGGEVRRQAIFELPPTRKTVTLREAMAMAGGTLVPGKFVVTLMKTMPDGTRKFVDISGQADATVQGGDVVLVKPSVDVAYGQIMLKGAARVPGTFSLDTFATLHDLIPSQESLRPDVYMLFGFIDRIDPKTMQHQLVPFSPLHVVQGRQNLALQSEDRVYLLTGDTMRAILRIAMKKKIDAEKGDAQWGDAQGEDEKQKSEDQDDVAEGDGARRNVRRDVWRNSNRRDGAQRDTAQRDTGRRGGTGSSDMYGRRSRQQPGGGLSGWPSANGSNQNGPYPNGDNQNGAYPSGDNRNGAYPNGTYPNGSYPNGSYPNGTYPNGASPDMPMGPSRRQDEPMSDEDLLFAELGDELAISEYVSPNNTFFGKQLVDYRVALSGAVHTGGYYLVAPDTSMAELLVAANGLADNVDLSSYELTSTVVDNQTGMETTTRNSYAASREELSSRVLLPKDEVIFHASYSNRQAGTVKIKGEVRYPGSYAILRNERLSDLLRRAGGLSENAYPYGAVFLRKSLAELEKVSNQRTADQVQAQLVQSMTRLGKDSKLDGTAYASLQDYVQELRDQPALGRMVVVVDPAKLAADPSLDPLLEPGDSLFIPAKPFAVSVMGEVLQPASVPYRVGNSAADYIALAGGYTQMANDDEIFVVRPDGSAYRARSSWFDFMSDDVPAGSTVYVGRDIATYDGRQLIIDLTTIFSQLATTAAAMAVLMDN